MALFGKKKNTEKNDAAVESKSSVVPALRSLGGGRDLSRVLKHARITEKATMSQGLGVYVFDISVDASKRDVMQAVKSLYNIVPRKVAVVTVPKKDVRNARTGRAGVKGGGKKAYVYLKKGETINIA